MVGACSSATVTVAVQEFEAPSSSVTVKVTVVVPTARSPVGSTALDTMVPSGSLDALSIWPAVIVAVHIFCIAGTVILANCRWRAIACSC